MEEWIVVENTPEKNNPALAIPKKIVVLDGSYDAWETFVEELKENGEIAYKLQSYSKYFKIEGLEREYYQTCKNECEILDFNNEIEKE